MKNIFLLIILIICDLPAFCINPDELSREIEEWKDDCYAQSKKNGFSSRTEFYTEKFYNIISKGPEISQALILEFKQGNGTVVVFFPKLFKAVFDSSFDSKDKKWLFTDYPKYIYYPPGFHLNKVKNNDCIWIYWWDDGRKLTPEIFERKYVAYQEAKKSGREDEIKEMYANLQNMGIIILPNLLDKIENGSNDLIPMFCYLSDQNDLKNTEDCKKWWKENSIRYKDLLNY